MDDGYDWEPWANPLQCGWAPMTGDYLRIQAFRLENNKPVGELVYHEGIVAIWDGKWLVLIPKLTGTYNIRLWSRRILRNLTPDAPYREREIESPLKRQFRKRKEIS